MDNRDLEIIQQRIGYRFKNLDLLQQAFVRRSYSQENGGEDNEVLEFIGDKVLDMIVVKLLVRKYGFMCAEHGEEEFDEFACEKDEAELTELKKLLVQKKTLAQRINVLELAEYLIVGNGDDGWRENSVKEDLFEAIIGAATIDSNWNMEELEALVDTMLCPDDVLAESETNYIAEIERWTSEKGIGTPRYHFENCGYGRMVMGGLHAVYPRAVEQHFSPDDKQVWETKLHCLMKISDNDEMPLFRGYGRSKTEARRNTCEVAYKYLERKGLLFSIRDEIPNPNENDAVSQLEILARRGYFSIPEYSFEEIYDRNGNPVWHCRCEIEGREKMGTASASSKKAAKKQAAFQLLTSVLGG